MNKEQLEKAMHEYNTIRLENLTDNACKIYLLTSSIFLSFIQVGFTCIIVGSVHSKNTADIMLKNFVGIFICGVSYYLTGHAFAFGEGSSIIGLTYWFNIGVNHLDLAAWYYNFSYASMVSAIVCSSMAERCSFSSSLVICAFISGFSYPISSHWVWHKRGFLITQGYKDSSGCGPIHVFSGTAAFVAAKIVGPRSGRFVDYTVVNYPSHSRILTGIGCFLRVTGEMLFSGSLTSFDEGYTRNYQSLSNHIMADICGGAGAFAISFLLGWLLFHRNVLPFEILMYGGLTGLVSCQASGNDMRGWEAAITGVLGCLVYYGLHYFLILMQVDDPIDITAIHLGGGVVGLLTTPFFGSKGIIRNPGNDSFKTLGTNALGCLSFVIWSGFTCMVMFGLLRAMKILRVTPEQEEKGLDMTYHRVIAYPPNAWEWGKL